MAATIDELDELRSRPDELVRHHWIYEPLAPPPSLGYKAFLGMAPDEEVIGAMAGDTFNNCDATLILTHLPNFISYAELRFRVTWTINDQARNTFMSAHFWAGNTTDMTADIATGSMQGCLLVLNCNAYGVLNDKQVICGDSFTMVSISQDLSKSSWLSNLDNDADYGKMTSLVRRLETRLKEAQITFLVLGTNEKSTTRSISEFAARIEQESKEPPLQSWMFSNPPKRPRNFDRSYRDFHSSSDSLSLSDDEYSFKAERCSQNFLLPFQTTFATFAHYSAIMDFANWVEFEQELEHADAVKNVSAYVFRASKSDDRTVNIVVGLNQKKIRLAAGDRVEIRFLRRNVTWEGVMKRRIPIQDVLYICCETYRPSEVDSRGKEVLAPLPPEFDDSHAVDSLDARLPQNIESLKTVSVDIRVIPSSEAYARQRKALRLIENTNSKGYSLARKMLCANDLACIPRIDLFDGMISSSSSIDELIHRMKERFKLSGEQRNVFDAVRNAIGGCTLVIGAPGVGKTMVFLALLRAVLSCTKRQQRCRAIFYAPTNSAVTRFLDLAIRDLNDLPVERPLMISRFNSEITDMKLVLQTVERTNQRCAKWLDRRDKIFLGLFLFACGLGSSKDTRHVASPAYAQHKDIGDPTVSIFYRMAQVAGMVDKGGPFDMTQRLEKNEDFKQWQNIYSTWRIGNKVDQQQCATLVGTLKKLQRFTLCMSDLIGITTNLVGHENFVEAKLTPSVLFGDEGAKQTEVDDHVVLSLFPTVPRVIAGDNHQAPPYVNSLESNGLGFQLQTPYLARGSACGLTTVRLTEQKRSSTDVAKVVAHFYPSCFYMTPKENFMDHPSRTSKILQYFGSAFGIGRSTVLIEVSNTSASRPLNDTSKSNDGTLSVSASLLQGIMSQGIKVENVGYLTPYVQQHSSMTDLIRDMSRTQPPVPWEKLWYGTVDRLQGGERDLVIVDLVSDEKIGFLREPGRLNTAFSRARIGLIIVMDKRMTLGEEWYKDSMIKMRQIHAYFKEEGMIREMNAKDYIAKYQVSLPLASKRSRKPIAYRGRSHWDFF